MKVGKPDDIDVMKGQQKLFSLIKSVTRRLAPIFLVVASTLITLELLLRVWSAVYVTRYTYTKSGTTDDVVVLTLGESTTAGVTDDVWPAQLEKLLRDTYPTRRIRVVNKAVPGTNTSILVGNLAGQIESIRPDVIVSMMGINDSDKHTAKSSGYIPNTKQERFIAQRFFRTVRLMTELILSRAYDLYVSRDGERLNKEAEEYRIRGEYELSEKYFLRCITIEPDNANHYVMLAIAYLDMQRLHEAEEMLLAARDVAPAAEGVYTELGNYYRDYGKLELAEEMFQKALAINPEYGLAYGAYATLLYWYRNDPMTAMGMYEKAIALYPYLVAPYFELADIYRSVRRYDDAVDLYEEALRREPGNKLAIRELANTKAVMSGGIVAGASVIAGQTASDALPAVTVENYRRMIRLAGGQNIPVVAVQYPLISAEPLHDLAHESRKIPGVKIEVADNEKNFQEALRDMKYSDLFTDYFAGNFGHATREGNRFIAESVFVAVKKFIDVQAINQ